MSMSQEQWARDWKKVRELGKGGQGTTYEVASSSNPGTRGVLKLLRDDGNQQARRRMAHEAINLDSLAKERVKVPRLLAHNTHMYGDASVQLYLVMEYVTGETLDAAVKNRGGRLPLEKSAAIAKDLCETMASMHKLDVLHRDLKPANLMVRDLEKADVVVLDLGLSFDRGKEQESVTRPGETIKNELFALPESITLTGNRRDPRSDITNIVGVFFYCLTGRLPGHLRDERNLAPHHRDGSKMQQILAGDVRAEQVELLLDSGFSVDIESRFQSIKELNDRLNFALTQVGYRKKDPTQAAKELAAKIRRHDRGLQLHGYIPAANELQSHVMRYAQTLAAQVQPFTVHLGGIRVNLPLPPGIDSVLDIGPAIVVGLASRPQTRIIRLYIGAKGDQCVLLRTSFVNAPSRPATPTPWKVVAWFDPTKTLDAQLVLGWVNDMVVEAMEEFERETSGRGPLVT
jgi:serine/threonine protein kinase